MIDQKRLIGTFIDLVKINSPSKHERGIVDYLRPKLEELGFDVEEDGTGEKIGGNAGNLIATKNGNAKNGVRLFFSAHMDTVEPTDQLELITTEDGTIHTGGKTILGADCKAGIASTLEAVRAAIESNVPFRSIQMVYSVAEEIGLMGARELDPEKIKADIGYVFDTEKPVAGIVVSAPSHENLLIRIFGKAAHAGIHPEDGVSAILAASRAIANMKLGRIDAETTANIGVISGGKARNVIPDYVEIRAEARSRNEEKLAAQVEHMVRTFHDGAKEIGADIDIEVTHEYTTYRWMPDDAPIKLATAACNAIGITPKLVEAGGGSDANVFNEKGIPSVVVGVGYEGAHSKDERIAIADLTKAAEFALALIAESGK